MANRKKQWTYIAGTYLHFVEGPSWVDEEAGIMDEEDACLIAAAPDLYREIKTALEYLEAGGYGKMPEAREEAEPEHFMVIGFRAAIAKAEGK